MYGDEYLYQELGYRHIYSKLKDVTEGDIVKRSVHISNIPVDSVTQDDIDEYNHFKKMNCSSNDDINRKIFIIADVIVALMLVFFTMLFIQERNISGIFICGCLFIFCAGRLAWMFMHKKKNEHLVNPSGVTRGYLVNTHVQSTTKRMLYGRIYRKITIYNQCSVIWIENKDMFLRNVTHSLAQFDHAGRKYSWSEVAYTPVKIFVFQDDSMELVPTFEKAK